VSRRGTSDPVSILETPYVSLGFFCRSFLE
jgi:hypothetical protein